jgi:hypothetical protein
MVDPATTGATGQTGATVPKDPIVGTRTGDESALSNWVGPYVTEMLGRGRALASEPYQAYTGPLTAGASNLQNKVFQGLGSLNFPSNLGQSFASPMGGNTNDYGGLGTRFFDDIRADPQTGAMPPYATRGNSANQGPKTEADWNRFSSMARFAPGTDMEAAKAQFLAGNQGGDGGGGAIPPGSDSQYGGSGRPGYDTGADGKIIPQLDGIAGLVAPQATQQPSNIAQSYMNPYLQSVLNPQLDELRRQNDITNMNTNAKLTQAGGYGGGRQAIMNAENNRNLLTQQNKTIGEGYATAYDKAMGQFNTEQGQSKDLANLMTNIGKTERDIESEGITADKTQFESERDYPLKQVQYMQSLLQNLPMATQQYSYNQPSAISQAASQSGGLMDMYDRLFGGKTAAK